MKTASGLITLFLWLLSPQLEAHPLVNAISVQEIYNLEQKHGIVCCEIEAIYRGGLAVPAVRFLVPGPLSLSQARELYLEIAEALSPSIMQRLRSLYRSCPITEFPLCLSLEFRDPCGCSPPLPFMHSVYTTDEQILYCGFSPVEGHAVTVHRENLWQAINEYQHRHKCHCYQR